MYKIIWSPEAEQDYERNIDYLLNNWTLKEATNFVIEVEETIEHLKKFPKMYSLSSYKNVRKKVICKQISLLYKINEENSTVELLRLWDTRQNPNKLKL
jgi:plasmid stabilization system protein ParE